MEKVGHDVADLVMKAELAEEVDNHLVVHGREELGDVDGEYRRVKPSVPVLRDDVHENDAHVCCSLLGDPAKLPRVEEAVRNAVKLKSFCQHLGHEFANCVKQGDWAESFWDVVAVLLQFWNDARVGDLEV